LPRNIVPPLPPRLAAALTGASILETGFSRSCEVSRRSVQNGIQQTALLPLVNIKIRPRFETASGGLWSKSRNHAKRQSFHSPSAYFNRNRLARFRPSLKAANMVAGRFAARPDAATRRPNDLSVFARNASKKRGCRADAETESAQEHPLSQFSSNAGRCFDGAGLRGWRRFSGRIVSIVLKFP
jgi:hypothetical protein